MASPSVARTARRATENLLVAKCIVKARDVAVDSKIKVNGFLCSLKSKLYLDEGTCKAKSIRVGQRTTRMTGEESERKRPLAQRW